ncbi:MAG: HAMP domain-containing protein [Chloroflexi bacterium]|nr:HAMP domain-containing protein [Chloroflexota bacterium]
MSLRTRLALWYGAVLALTLLLFGVFLQATLARMAVREVDRSLADQAREVNASTRIEAMFFRRQRVALPDPDVFAGAGMFVQIADLGGQVFAASANLADRELPLDREVLAAVRQGQAHYQTLRVGNTRLRLFSAPLRVGNQPLGVLQVARTLEPLDYALGGLRLLLLGGGVVGLVASVLVGGALARAALRPIDRITQTTRDIGASRDFSRRVADRGPQDEVGRLAATFNAMLEQLQRAYADLQQANTRLEAALTSQRRFVADASHELRTPLTTVRGNAELLRRVPEMTPQDREEALAQIESEAARMSRLVQDLLTLARADAGQRLRQQPVALRPLVEDVERQVRVLAGGVRVGLAEVAEASVQGDPDALRQLLLILLDNAIKYTPPGGSVTVSAAQENGEVRLRVADTGVGIAAEDLPHIFERFYRGDRARQAGGTGLGLAIAQWIAREHRGRITVESAPGRGSVFTVHLPATAGRNGTGPAVAPAHRGPFLTGV